MRAILKHHNCSIAGNKDQLVIKVLLLRQGETAAILVKEEQELKELIKIAQQLIFAERFLKLSKHIYRQRTYRTTTNTSFLQVPISVHSETDLTDIFLPLLKHITLQHDQRAAQDKSNTISLVHKKAATAGDFESLKQQLVEVGAKSKVKWSIDEIGDSGWKPGWCIAYVQSYDAESDVITLQYPSEPECIYPVELMPLLTAGKIQLVQAVI